MIAAVPLIVKDVEILDRSRSSKQNLGFAQVRDRDADFADLRRAIGCVGS